MLGFSVECEVYMILSGNFVYCFGITKLDFEFDFSPLDDKDNSVSKAYAIYAPNGVMKSSFARTFFEYSKNGKGPDKEERYNKLSTCSIKADGNPISSQMIYVVDSSNDINSTSLSNSVTNILVDPDRKKRYDRLVIELDKKKKELLRDLNQLSGVRQVDIENCILEDFDEKSFPECLVRYHSQPLEDDYSSFSYSDIFSKATESVISSLEFQNYSREFSRRYQELFDTDGSIFKKGVFNPGKAKDSLVALTKSGFFDAAHKVKLRGEENAISRDEYDQRYKSCIAKIETDEKLKTIRSLLEKNESTKSLFRYLEELDNAKLEFFLNMLSPEHQPRFKRELWIQYLQNSAYTRGYLETYNRSKKEIAEIEAEARGHIKQWINAVNLFNDRFVDMPCELDIVNYSDTVLGKEKAILVFKFKDGESNTEMLLNDVRTLSTGEMRAFCLLNVIFEAANRQQNNTETLFVFDDVVDSFDYKNKAAIIQYLDDLAKIDCFYQIILTHNFDFYRALALSFVARDRCLTTVIDKNSRSITLEKADGIKNCFIGIIKAQIQKSDVSLCASIPFARNIIEYTRGEDNTDYKTLTKLLHWKNDSVSITIKDYLSIYNNTFDGNITRIDDAQIVTKLILNQANSICTKSGVCGFNIIEKIVLCMAIRIIAEKFMINILSDLLPAYTYNESNQYGDLLEKIKCCELSSDIMRTLNKISITVSSNLHINSFMYEPIIDLSIEALIDLYSKVQKLECQKE